LIGFALGTIILISFLAYNIYKDLEEEEIIEKKDK